MDTKFTTKDYYKLLEDLGIHVEYVSNTRRYWFIRTQGGEYFDEFFLDNINTNQSSLRRIICLAVNNGIPIPAFSNALQYIDAHRSPKIGANLIQAQRDYFGAHTFERIDKPGAFHHEWQEHYSK